MAMGDKPFAERVHPYVKMSYDTWQERLFRNEIPRLPVESPDLIKRMKAEQPVVITGTRLVESATARWTLEYWAAEAGDHNSFHVNLAPGMFLYSDLENNPGKFQFTPAYRAIDMPFAEFAQRLRHACALEGRRAFDDSPDKPEPVDARSSSETMAEMGLAPTREEWDAMQEYLAEESRRELAGTEVRDWMVDEWRRYVRLRGDFSDQATAGSSAQEETLPSPAREAGDESEACGGTGLVRSSDPEQTIAPEEFRAKSPVPPFHERWGGRGTERLYLQQMLYSGLGPRIVEDFRSFNWSVLHSFQHRTGCGQLTSNNLFLGMRGTVTAFHFGYDDFFSDEQANFFAQIRGRKLAIIADPAEWAHCYPYPVGHPADRQSQVNIRAPDFRRFPSHRRTKFLYTVLQPGDVLFLPPYWWHQMESPWEESMSLSFWYKAAPLHKPDIPLTNATQQVALRRNLEKLISGFSSHQRLADFCRRLQLGYRLNETDEMLRRQALTLLAQVIRPEDCEMFLEEVVAGRFDLPRLPADDAPPLPALMDRPSAGAGGRAGDNGTAKGAGSAAAAATPPSRRDDSSPKTTPKKPKGKKKGKKRR